MSLIFYAIANPPQTEGEDYSKCEVLTVPQQAISLEEMLQRFTLGEPLDVEHKGGYVEDLSDSDDYSDPNLGDVDLEKLGRADLVDKAEFAQRLKKTRETFAMEDKARREKEERERKEKEEEEIFQRVSAKKKTASPKKEEPGEGSEVSL